MAAVWLIGSALALACGPTTTPTTTPHPDVETAEIAVTGTGLTVWVADTREERGRGLRNVESLPAGIDGMLFVWDSPTNATFGMRDTLIPLDIWWFDGDGVLLGMTKMSTCLEGECPAYPSPGAVRWALETPQGAHVFPPGATLTTSANG